MHILQAYKEFLAATWLLGPAVKIGPCCAVSEAPAQLAALSPVLSSTYATSINLQSEPGRHLLLLTGTFTLAYAERTPLLQPFKW